MMVGFNIQSTGLNPSTARMVEYGIAVLNSEGKVKAVRQEIVDSGEPIPSDAERIHRIDTFTAQTQGVGTWDAMETLMTMLSWAASTEEQLAVFNAPYTLTLLRAEAARLGMADTLLGLLSEISVVDPLILDKELSPFRPGPRDLDTLVLLYDVPWEGEEVDDPGELEDSVAVSQALKAAALAVFLCSRPIAQDMSAKELHAAQVAWAENQQQGLRDHYRRKNQPNKAKEVYRGWPFQGQFGNPKH